jgi:hypothetical protein
MANGLAREQGGSGRRMFKKINIPGIPALRRRFRSRKKWRSNLLLTNELRGIFKWSLHA